MLLPDSQYALAKANEEFPWIFKWNIAAASLLVLVVMYSVIGLSGLLIYLAGVVTLISIIAGLLFLYTANEYSRARAQTEAM